MSHLTLKQLARHHDRQLLLCQTCEDACYTADDTYTYICKKCGKGKAGTRFDTKQFYNFHQCDKGPLTCLECRKAASEYVCSR